MIARVFLSGSLTLLALAAAQLVPGAALAQGRFPERPLRLVVPFAPGGVNDIIGRRWAQEMSRALGQNMIVENRAGASGAIGAMEVVRAKPDGYTLLIANTTTHVLNPLGNKKLGYDPLKDFTALGIITLVPTGVAVHPSLPVKNLKELIAFARKNPGQLSFGSAGTGSITHLTGELFKKLNGNLNIVHVPYKGAGPGLSDLVAGHIPMYTPTISPAPLEYHKAGRIRMLAICADERLKAVPDVPTAPEAGMPELIVQAFNAIFMPAGVPRPVIDVLGQANQKVLANAGMQDFLRKAGAEPVTTSSPERATQFIQQELQRWGPIVRETAGVS
ncbi:MAG: Tripartite tricarboxylate transporter family receptor [Proteobacteria bacterium]|nr:Tripartite tricarboxylate transporter family receptor [Pseudomonadota bacterium]RPJ44425.1 MAG: tripartite tricarboxylate transporter substrate binding protein [Betaproteobacteria bacterium]